MKNTKAKKQKSKERGFTLLFAVLVSAVLLSIGLSIADITLQQFLLSSSGRESQFAFYAADSGAECALYWDRHGNPSGTSAFATSTQGTYLAQGSATCNLSVINTTPSSEDSDSSHAVTIFYIDYPKSNPSDLNDTETCSKVTVTKNPDGTTIIDSRGYNSGLSADGTCNLTGPQTVERGIELNF